MTTKKQTEGGIKVDRVKVDQGVGGTPRRDHEAEPAESEAHIDENGGLVYAVGQELDVTGLICPLPVLKAQKTLKSMAIGEVLLVIATDPASAIDFPHFCAESGHQLIQKDRHDPHYRFWIRKRKK